MNSGGWIGVASMRCPKHSRWKRDINVLKGVINEIKTTIAHRYGWTRKRFSTSSRIQSPNRIPCQNRGDHAG